MPIGWILSICWCALHFAATTSATAPAALPSIWPRPLRLAPSCGTSAEDLELTGRVVFDGPSELSSLFARYDELVVEVAVGAVYGRSVLDEKVENVEKADVETPG